jgi:hypothetical protein
MLMIIMLRYTNMKNDIFLTFKIIISFEYIYIYIYIEQTNYKLLQVRKVRKTEEKKEKFYDKS